MKKQTAVEWLVEQIESYEIKTDIFNSINLNVPKRMLEQAKAMEKKQIVNAWDLSRRDIDYPADGEEYYNNNYYK